MHFLWNTWFVVALCAPALWAITNLIDVYFVEDIYESPLDGLVVASFFQIIPWCAVPLGLLEFHALPLALILLFLLGGFLCMVSFYFYFKALFRKNDASLVQVLWTLSLPLVPVFSWIVFGERLGGIQYVGIFVAFLGGFFLSLDTKIRSEGLWSVAKSMFLANVCMAASMVIQSHTYEIVGENNFWSGYLLFSFGAFLVAPLVWVTASRSSRVFLVVKRYWYIFFASEGLALFGFLSSQRALALSPSPSFVAVMETLLPAFVLIFSILAVVFLRAFRIRTSFVQEMYREQSRGALVKVASIAVVAMGIYLL